MMRTSRQWMRALVVATLAVIAPATLQARDPGINQPGAVGNPRADPGVNQPGAVGNVGAGGPGAGVRDPGLNQPGVVTNRRAPAARAPGVGAPGSAWWTPDSISRVSPGVSAALPVARLGYEVHAVMRAPGRGIGCGSGVGHVGASLVPAAAVPSRDAAPRRLRHAARVHDGMLTPEAEIFFRGLLRRPPPAVWRRWRCRVRARMASNK